MAQSKSDRVSLHNTDAVVHDKDELDRKIISILQTGGHASNARIARQVGVSEGTVRRRLKRLVQDDMIRVAVTSNSALQMALQVGEGAFPKLRLRIEPEAEPYLTANIANLINSLHALIAKQGAESSIPIEGTAVGLKRSSEDDWTELVFRVYVRANDVETIAFWDNLGEAIQEWAKTLPASSQKLLAEQVGVFVEPLR